MEEDKINHYLQKMESIPSLPSVVMELVKLIDNPLTSSGQIEALLAKDQGLTLKVLKLANSAYYAVPGGASTLKRAVVYLGMNTIKQLVMTASVMSTFKKIDSPTFPLVEFWKHSFAVGLASDIIAKRLKVAGGDEAFICGLTHDLGKLVLLLIDKDLFLKVVSNAKSNKMTIVESELSLGVPSHALLGALLAKKWKLPEGLQYVLQHHHTEDAKSREGLSPGQNQLVDVVLVANQIVHSMSYGNSGYDVIPKISLEAINRLSLEMETKADWYLKVVKCLEYADKMVQELN